MNKILIIMSDNRSLTTFLEDANYNSLSVRINHNYSIINGYDFIYYQPYYKKIDLTTNTNCFDFKNNQMRHSAWSKLLSTIKAIDLGEHDYIVYIDTDAIFRTLDYKIETIIEKYIGNNDFIFFDNSSNLLTIGPENCPCSGFYILKVNEKSREDIVNWYNVNMPDFNIVPFWEQMGLWWEMIKKMNATIAPEPHFDEVHGQFVRHLHSGIMGLRMPYFTNLIKEYGLDLKDNLKINHIKYDTSIMLF
jgi:hypothetical protein